MDCKKDLKVINNIMPKMDVFSHGIWTGILCKIANKKIKKKLNLWLSVFFGVFPDVFSFAMLFIWLISQITFGNLGFKDMPKLDETEPAVQDKLSIFDLTSTLYSLSHSLFVFLIVFLIVTLILKQPLLEMLGWLFHIIIDIPTHSYKFYPTPFLWPFSSWKFNGISWGTPWFMILNVSAIVIMILVLRKNGWLKKVI